MLRKEADLLNDEAKAANAARDAIQEQLDEAQQRNQLLNRDCEKRIAAAFKSCDEWRVKVLVYTLLVLVVGG